MSGLKLNTPKRRLRFETHGSSSAMDWRVFDADSGENLSGRIGLEWTAKFAKANVGDSFYFTLYVLGPDRRPVVNWDKPESRIVRERVHALIVERT